MNLPETPEQVTPQWMSWALAKRYPGVEVTSVEVLAILAATATKVRVALGYNDAGKALGLPPTMIVKGPFSRNADLMEHTFTDEMRGYRDIVSDIGINTPICHFAEKQGKNPIVIIEDLTSPHCIFSNAHRPMGFDEAKSVLDALAVLHARYWQHPDLADDGAFNWVLRTVTGWHLDFMETYTQPDKWAFFVSLPRGCAVPHHVVTDLPRLKRAMHTQFASHGRHPLTLCHGDAHTANIYFNEKGGGLFDWEMRRSPWFHDVTYMLMTSLDIVDRRRWLNPLLNHYLERLAGLGIAAPAFDEALRLVSREVIYGYMLFMMNGDGTEYWTEAANTAVMARYGAAMEDLDTLRLIEADH